MPDLTCLREARLLDFLAPVSSLKWSWKYVPSGHREHLNIRLGMKGCPHRSQRHTQSIHINTDSISRLILLPFLVEPGQSSLMEINIPMKYVYPCSSWVQTPNVSAWILASPMAGIWIYKCLESQCYFMYWYRSFHPHREMSRSSLVPQPTPVLLPLDTHTHPEQVLGPRTLHLFIGSSGLASFASQQSLQL